MPSASLKACSYPGCITLVSTGRCDQHRQAEIVYRNPETQRLYDRKWKQRRIIELADHPWCEDCLEQGRYTPATDAHHEQRHQGDLVVFLTSPIRMLCHACHTRHTNEEINNSR